MFPLSMVWFCIKRMPRIFALCFNMIVIFLTIFLLLGCYNESSLSTFLVSYRFEPSSPFYSVIESSFQGAHGRSNSSLDGLETVRVKSGYMGVCLLDLPKGYSDGSTTVCYPRKNLFNTGLYSDLSIELFNLPTSNGTSPSPSQKNVPIKLNILQLGQLTSVEIIHPYILMATVVLSCVMFLLIIYVTLPKVPKKSLVNRLLLIWSSALTLLWGFGTMWTHVGINASAEMVSAASMGIIRSSKGKKAAALSWCAFAFLLIDCLIIWLLYFRDRKKLSDEIDKVRASDSYQSSKYHSDSSTLA
ncbi:hypothetical protein HG536_0C03110 [Torulaspora globosa]|uniref:Uncharacterized protein n=1 Tax=Torulaspora globosa TaxID=48254 RepID=A0A7G3ZF57_9SACH|nr:uncharacterized protein HG536_0C03110 [Torulaspora globosa]QLL32143.1 hypothetical protein HG536_0C03110 [Torulaspora globosa]